MTEYRHGTTGNHTVKRQHAQSAQTYRRDAHRYHAGPATTQRRRSKLPFVIGIALLCVLAFCVVQFISCSNATPQQATQQESASSSSDAGDSSSSTLTANELNRAQTSTSANDVKPTKKVVYLTFDDGPSEHTHQILDTLDKYGIKATWFILGNTGHIDYVKDIWDRGNQIGLHSQEHDYNKIYANTDNFVADIEGIGKVVSKYIGFTPTLIRFPGGSNNGYNAGRADSFKKAAAAQGWHYFDWNVSIGDSTPTPSDPDVLFNNIVEESQGCNSCCVLMHDSDFKPTTPDALPRIIEYYQSQGFTFDVLAADSYGYHF